MKLFNPPPRLALAGVPKTGGGRVGVCDGRGKTARANVVDAQAGVFFLPRFFVSGANARSD